MICQECSKLAIKDALKKCKRCKMDVHDNISIICNRCSSDDMICSVCLKKVYSKKSSLRKTLGTGGCGSCGRG